MSNVAIVFGVMGTFSQVTARDEALSFYGCYPCMIVPRSLRANYDHRWPNEGGPKPRALISAPPQPPGMCCQPANRRQIFFAARRASIDAPRCPPFDCNSAAPPPPAAACSPRHWRRPLRARWRRRNERATRKRGSHDSARAWQLANISPRA